MSEETKTMNTTPTNSTPEASGGQGEKMFTQDEVNRIVSDRLARERAKMEPTKEDERETALRAREKAVEAREARYKCEDYLAEMKVDAKFVADILSAIDTSDFDKFKAAADILGKYFIPKTEVRSNCHPANPPMNCGGGIDAQIADAFKPKF